MRFSTFLQAVGKNIKAERVRRGLRQADLEEKTGISLRYLQDLEYGKVNLTLRTLHAVAMALKVSPEALIRCD